MTTTEKIVRHQLGYTRPIWEHPDQVFWVSIQLFKPYQKRGSYTVHKKFNCRWDNLYRAIADYIDEQTPKVRTFWIFGVRRIKPSNAWLELFHREKHKRSGLLT